ncbi:hypothetical protein [Achromobacter xylosoxidans]|uniref:hypothetical protein n=1 Tax=Alcaligenes xylosoxydans xylosoxydans TaxID=85698 RepID=UPI001EEE3473|nr:hypothetical protein [Achromobacter xylosoxidans]
MQPKIHIFDGVPFVATPYRPGAYIRSDVFWRQFTISCQGEIEYPEDDPIYGTWWTPHVLTLGEHGLIESAMALATRCVTDHAFDLGDDIEALDFYPELVLIHDFMGRLVLAGQPCGQGIRWCEPVTSDEEVASLSKEINALRGEASYEAGWDNYSTAKDLRLRARVLAGRLVDPFWRDYARAILAASAVDAAAVH